MQQFFIDYGLWLLIALLVVIGVMFLLAGRGKSGRIHPAEPSVAPEPREAAPPASVTPAPAPVIEPVAPETPAAVAPAPMVEPVAPEPTAPVAPVSAEIPISPAATTPSVERDDLLKLKGVGPKLNMLLLELGVTRYAQIADWTDSDIAAIDAKLGNFKGRPVRDQWVDQAKYLAAGDIAGFEAKYGKI